MYTSASGATGVTGPNVALATAPGANLAITANVQVDRATGATGLARCELTLDGTILDGQQVTVPVSAVANTGGETLTLVGTDTAAGSGVVRVQCFATNSATFSDLRIQAISLDAIN
jgi:hypothetical protein